MNILVELLQQRGGSLVGKLTNPFHRMRSLQDDLIEPLAKTM